MNLVARSSVMVVSFVLCAHFGGVQATAQTFEKNASKFCVSNLSAAEQSQYYSRIMNIGASYTHGCSICDVNKSWRENVQLDGDYNWIRRNYLAQFLAVAPWKNKKEFSWEMVSVVENDAHSNLATVYTNKELRKEPYNSRWVFYPELDRSERMDVSTEKYIASSPGFKDEADLVGGATLRKNNKKRVETARHGHLYQTVPGKFAAEGAQQKTIVDLAIDRSRSPELMKFYGNDAVFQDLVKNGWEDKVKREQLIETTATYLQSMSPSIVIGVDFMFWDAVPYMFHYANVENPKSIVMKFITTQMFGGVLGLEFYGETQRNNMTDDLFEVFRRVSVGASNRKPVPVLLGRLIDNPGRFIVGNGLEPEFGALIGQFISIFTGRDFTTEVTAWLKKISYEDLPPTVANGASIQGKNRVPRKGGYKDDKGNSFSSVEVANIRALLEDIETSTEAELAKNGFQPVDLIPLPASTDDSPDAVSTRAAKPSVPWALRGAVNAIILSGLKDLPLLIKSADRAFNYQNAKLRQFTALPNNNVHIVDVDLFYQNFHKVVNARTMHPSVAGAKFMAQIVDTAVCTSQGAN